MNQDSRRLLLLKLQEVRAELHRRQGKLMYDGACPHETMGYCVGDLLAELDELPDYPTKTLLDHITHEFDCTSGMILLDPTPRKLIALGDEWHDLVEGYLSPCYWHGWVLCRCEGIESVQDLRRAVASRTLFASEGVFFDACSEISNHAEQWRGYAQPDGLLRLLDELPRSELSRAGDIITYVFDDIRFFPEGWT